VRGEISKETIIRLTKTEELREDEEEAEDRAEEEEEANLCLI